MATIKKSLKESIIELTQPVLANYPHFIFPVDNHNFRLNFQQNGKHIDVCLSMQHPEMFTRGAMIRFDTMFQLVNLTDGTPMLFNTDTCTLQQYPIRETIKYRTIRNIMVNGFVSPTVIYQCFDKSIKVPEFWKKDAKFIMTVKMIVAMSDASCSVIFRTISSIDDCPYCDLGYIVPMKCGHRFCSSCYYEFPKKSLDDDVKPCCETDAVILMSTSEMLLNAEGPYRISNEEALFQHIFEKIHKV